ncbi:MAG: hypothetical protein PCFJNLEI_02654 [Verrucomicrobiae bacterium]|nr:hypothetical protein [Verrucomicrobiae bacterium]
MKLLVIGGSGFVSGTLARVARGAGHQVWTLTRGQRPALPGVTALVADRQDPAAVERVLASTQTDWDLAVDCIGFKPADARQDIAVFAPRARQLVFISTDFVYDPTRRQLPQPEEPAHYVTADYGGDKRQCELEFLNSDNSWTILRPCHIYGPGSLLGCLPEHGRDPQLLDTLRSGQPLRLVGGGLFRQQPIHVRDLAMLILSIAGKATTHRQIFNCAGPDIIESREYYRIVAEVLGVELRVTAVSMQEVSPFLCHRIYDLGKLRQAGLTMPATPITAGLQEHTRSLLTQSG